MFSEQELAFLRGQPLARIGTVDDQGQPTVDAVGFEFDGMRFYMSGHRNAMTNMICAHLIGSASVAGRKARILYDDTGSQYGVCARCQ